MLFLALSLQWNMLKLQLLLYLKTIALVVAVALQPPIAGKIIKKYWELKEKRMLAKTQSELAKIKRKT